MVESNYKKKKEKIKHLGRNRFILFWYSENELEEVLTIYTKLNKSAAIFLGSNSKSNLATGSHNHGNSNHGIHQSSSDTSLPRRKESMEHLPPGIKLYLEV